MIRRQLLLGTVSIAALSACSNSDGSVDIGRNVGGALSDYAASWDGYAEAYSFSDGSDRVRITLDANGQGTVVFGDAAVPTLPDPGDPAAFDAASGERGSLLPGLPYPVGGARVDGQRIRLSANLYEPYRQFCEAQTTYCDAFGCGCLPNGSTSCGETPSDPCTVGNPDGGPNITVPYATTYFCRAEPVCSCTASGCSLGTGGMLFDGALENAGTQLVGTFTLTDRVTVRMLKH